MSYTATIIRGGIIVHVRSCEPGEHSNYVWTCGCGKWCWIATRSNEFACDSGERHLRDHGEQIVGLIAGHVERLPRSWDSPDGTRPANVSASGCLPGSWASTAAPATTDRPKCGTSITSTRYRST